MQDSWIDQNEIDELLGSFKGAGSKRGLRPLRDTAKVAGVGESVIPPADSPRVILPDLGGKNVAPKPVTTPAKGFFNETDRVDDPVAYPVRSSFWEDDLDTYSSEVTASPSERDAAKAAQALGEARRRADESQLLKISVALPRTELDEPPVLPPLPPHLGESVPPVLDESIPPVLEENIPPVLPDLLSGNEPSLASDSNIMAGSGDSDVAMSRRITSLLEQVRAELSPRFIAITDDKGFLLHGDDVLDRGHIPEPRDVFQTQRFFGDHAEEVVQVCDGAGWWYIKIPALWPHGHVSWQMETKEPVEMTAARRYAKLLADTMFPVNSNRAGEQAAFFQ